MEKTVSFYTLGCRLNQSETAVLSRHFELSGYRVVDFDHPADFVVINTCTVTENGDADTRHAVYKAARTNPQTRIALIGCQAQTQKEKLVTLPNVKLVVGNAQKMDLVNIVQQAELSETPLVLTPAIERASFTLPAAAIDRTHTRANLKIQDGCDFFCSFCEIPYARGRARSRVFEDIILEANALAAAGYREVVLTGVNMGTYRESGKTILDIIDELEKISEIRRVRISSIEPTTVPFELIQRMGKTKLCRHLHIPLQSGSSTVLKAMQRKYTTEEFKDFILKTAATVPQLCIGTDVIVGFPGETERLFEETVCLLKSLPVSYFHVFSYSDRTFNKSRNFKDKIPSDIIRKRSEALRTLGNRKRNLFLRSLIGTTQSVLFETQKDSLASGLTDNYARVELTTERKLRNEFIPVKLTEVKNHALSARLPGRFGADY